MKIKNSLLVFLIAILSVSCQQRQQKPVVDILITGGELIDGTANGETRQTTIEIVADRITYVGSARGTLARQTIDASGLVVSPGFIDVHTHTAKDLKNPATAINEAYLRQGVSTVFIGNDGNGQPVKKAAAQLKKIPIGTNVGLYIGHGTVRKLVVGDDDRVATAAELEQMKSIVARSMEAGALGLSSGLFYAPGSYAKTEEVIELAKIIARYDGVYDSHIRDESDYNIGLLASIQELIRIAREADVAAHIAHIKALGPSVHGLSVQAVELINQARKQGLRITADQYPWLASGTRLSNALIPRSAMDGGKGKMRALLADTKSLKVLRPQIEQNLRRRGGAGALLITGQSIYRGKTLAELATKEHLDAIDMAARIILSGDPAIASFMMDQEDVQVFMRQPWTVTSSDGTNGHPRKFGSFPKKYQDFVVAKKLLDIRAFVHRSTGLAANIFKLCDRGVIKAGKIADIVIWHPDQFRSLASYEKPEETAQGVVHLLVNGQLAIYASQLTNNASGQILRRGQCNENTAKEL